jgi:hypothetical protein
MILNVLGLYYCVLNLEVKLLLLGYADKIEFGCCWFWYETELLPQSICADLLSVVFMVLILVTDSDTTLDSAPIPFPDPLI